MWSKEEFDMLSRCGITPEGEYIKRYNATLELEKVWNEYEHFRASTSAAELDPDSILKGPNDSCEEQSKFT